MKLPTYDIKALKLATMKDRIDVQQHVERMKHAAMMRQVQLSMGLDLANGIFEGKHIPVATSPPLIDDAVETLGRAASWAEGDTLDLMTDALKVMKDLRKKFRDPLGFGRRRRGSDDRFTTMMGTQNGRPLQSKGIPDSVLKRNVDRQRRKKDRRSFDLDCSIYMTMPPISSKPITSLTGF